MAAVEPLVYSVSEAAEALRISRRTLFDWTQSGDLPHFRRGGRVLYPVDQLREWIHRNSTNRIAPPPTA